MASALCLFEDTDYRKLLPLVYTRPVYDLRCGTCTLGEKIIRQYSGATVIAHCRGELVSAIKNVYHGLLVNELPHDSCLLINGRLLADKNLPEKIPLQGEDCLFISGETLVAARVSGKNLERLRQKLGSGPITIDLFSVDRTQEVEVQLISYPWNLVNHNSSQIEADWEVFGLGGRIKGHVYDGATLLNREKIFLAQGTKLKPGAVLDAEGGPIIIEPGATIFPNATIEGPAFIGARTLIKTGAKIYKGTSIGEVCKVGGEVEESIIHSYSNKQHEGFLGHSYLGMWVNLGAGTNNSDLKNNYSNVKAYVDGEMVDSGSMFVGLTMSDHSKSGINTMFNTGTVVGVSCNVYGGGFPPKLVPSFTWGGAEGLVEYRLDKALEMARAVMGRCKLELTPAHEELIRAIFRETAPERAKLK